MRAADNAPDPSRGLTGYVTTYQGVAAVPDLHLLDDDPRYGGTVRKRGDWRPPVGRDRRGAAS